MVLNHVSVVGAEVLVVGLLGHAFLTACKDCPGIEASHFGNWWFVFNLNCLDCGYFMIVGRPRSSEAEIEHVPPGWQGALSHYIDRVDLIRMMVTDQVT